MFGTHPPVGKRIQVLRRLAGGVNYNEYQKAFSGVMGKRIIPRSGLEDSEAIPIKKPAAVPKDGSPSKTEKKELGDLIRAVNGFIFLTCACGLKIKIPPGFKSTDLTCPRCRKTVTVPMAQLGALAGISKLGKRSGKAEKTPSTYSRRGDSWESVACRCGNNIPLSPALKSATVRCSKCNSSIEIRPSSGHAAAKKSG